MLHDLLFGGEERDRIQALETKDGSLLLQGVQVAFRTAAAGPAASEASASLLWALGTFCDVLGIENVNSEQPTGAGAGAATAAPRKQRRRRPMFTPGFDPLTKFLLQIISDFLSLQPDVEACTAWPRGGLHACRKRFQS